MGKLGGGRWYAHRKALRVLRADPENGVGTGVGLREGTRRGRDDAIENPRHVTTASIALSCYRKRRAGCRPKNAASCQADFAFVPFADYRPSRLTADIADGTDALHIRAIHVIRGYVQKLGVPGMIHRHAETCRPRRVVTSAREGERTRPESGLASVCPLGQSNQRPSAPDSGCWRARVAAFYRRLSLLGSPTDFSRLGWA